MTTKIIDDEMKRGRQKRETRSKLYEEQRYRSSND